jgi:hypothetical protein
MTAMPLKKRRARAVMGVTASLKKIGESKERFINNSNATIQIPLF